MKSGILIHLYVFRSKSTNRLQSLHLISDSVKNLFAFVNVLTLYNTQETVTFEEIKGFEQLSEETQKPLSDYAESGSCGIEFGSPDWT